MTTLAPGAAVTAAPGSGRVTAAVTGPRRPPTLPRGGRLVVPALAAAAVWTALALVVLLPLPALPAAAHDAVLLVHLAAVVLGLGAVLAIDWHGMLWLAGRLRLEDLLAVTARLVVPVWLGLAGLVASGALLLPQTPDLLTVVKLVLVAVVAANGVNATALEQRMRAAAARAGGRLPRRLLLRGLTAGAVSQLGWWGATIIGFLHAR